MNFLNNLTPVVKNLLIINVIFFIAKYLMQMQGIELGYYLGLHNFGSPLFKPYQLATHFFMHADLFHIIFNMFALVVFGSNLERVWGPKRFFIFYVVSAMGAIALFGGISYFEFAEIKSQLLAENVEIFDINQILVNNVNYVDMQHKIYDYAVNTANLSQSSYDIAAEYAMYSYSPMVGASGAVFGLLAAFAYLFPNTELQLLFPPIPIKAKWLVGGYMALEIYLSFQNNPGDNVAHLAHVGGGIAGFILVLIWNRTKKTFY